MAPSYPPCSKLSRLAHPHVALEAPLAELLRVAHELGVPLVVWSGGRPTATEPGRLVAHQHVCAACEPLLAAFITDITEQTSAALVAAGGVADARARPPAVARARRRR